MEDGIDMMVMMKGDQRYHEWTPCEFYGHSFVDGRCVDCGESDGQDEKDQL